MKRGACAPVQVAAVEVRNELVFTPDADFDWSGFYTVEAVDGESGARKTYVDLRPQRRADGSAVFDLSKALIGG